MFILDKSKFVDFDLTNAEQFVNLWSNYYEYTLKDENVYIKELNIKNDLTEDNVKKLLRWKDPRWLSGETCNKNTEEKNDENTFP